MGWGTQRIVLGLLMRRLFVGELDGFLLVFCPWTFLLGL
jgi:hypothetical protein